MPGAGGTSQDRNIYLCLVLTGVSRKGIKHEPLRYLPMRQDGTMLPFKNITITTKISYITALLY
jgi:hypothetical protein